MKQAKYPIQGSNIVKKYTLNSAFDVSRNGGQISGGVSFSNGVASFNGSSSTVLYPSKSFNEISVRAKVKFTNSNSLKTIFSFGTGGDLFVLGTGIQSGTGTDNDINFGMFFSSWKVASSGITPVLGQEYEIIGTMNGSDIKIYVDGVLEGTTSGVGFDTRMFPIQIGKRFDGTNPNWFDGNIDLVEIYNKVLTDSEVSNLYNNRQYKGLVTNGLVGYWDFTRQSVFDFSNNGNDGTLTAGNGGFKKQGLLFDGSATEITIPASSSLQPTSAISLIGVVSTNTKSLPNGFRMIQSLSSVHYLGIVTDVTPIFYVKLEIDGIQRAVGAIMPEINRTYHVMVTWESGSPIKLYVDGVKVIESGVFSGSLNIPSMTRYIAEYTSTGFNWSGLMKAVATYNRAVTAEEISQLYQLAKTNFNL